MTARHIPFLDLSHQNQPFEEQFLLLWREILQSGQFVSGGHVARFESAFAAAHQVKHAIAVSNGTVALELALRALGLQHGQSVVVPTNSFIATAEAVSNAGGIPLLVDCQIATSNIDPALVESAIRPDTWGIIGVHLYGTPCDMTALAAISRQHDLVLVEDAAQAHLAKVGDRTVGGLGAAAGFSFYPGKNLGAPGEGGAITTDHDDLAARLRALRDHGQSEKYHSDYVGTNARMSEIVAATLGFKLSHLPGWNRSRREVASMYRDRLAGESTVTMLEVTSGAESVNHLFPVEVANRDQVRELLAVSGVGTGLHYPVPIHLQQAYSHLGYVPGDLPIAERKAATVLSLPMYPGMSPEDVDFVVDQLVKAVTKVGA
jgi:dTDP-4-amino-4,6-dideoxygalactose transaminase